MTTFSISNFVTACCAAMDAAEDRHAAAATTLRAAIDEHGPAAIIEALQAAVPPGASVGEMIVHASDDLTVLFARIPARFQSGLHDHTVAACIGQLTGLEQNRFYEKNGEGLEEVRSATVEPCQVIELPADVIHSIENPTDEVACALHLYLGNFKTLSDERSLYDGESHERIDFSFPKLVEQSVKRMKKNGNRAGLEAAAEAIPALRPLLANPA